MRNIPKLTAILFTLFVSFNSCKKDQTDQNIIDEETFTDQRDLEVYPIKKIGTQVWMTKNLNYAAKGSWCNDCATYGRLYDWNTAIAAAPLGWHIPSDTEWDILVNYLGGDSVGGGKMKSTSGWDIPNTGASNSSGFTGLPGGLRIDYNGEFYNIGFNGLWWSSTTDGNNRNWIRGLANFREDVYRTTGKWGYAFSIRCIRN